MTIEQEAAHLRMLNRLRGRAVASDEWLDQPENWTASNRPLSPSERMYTHRANESTAA
jgi:hypothetical protein